MGDRSFTSVGAIRESPLLPLLSIFLGQDF